MAIKIISPANSFVSFQEECGFNDCNFGEIAFNLPVYEASDVFFQAVIEGTQGEIDALCTLNASEVSVSLVDNCAYGAGLIDFSQKPDRFRLSPTQILYNWQRGFPGFPGAIQPEQCFKIRLTVGGVQFCSNCFERIVDPCYTSVIEYGNEEDAFGFKYCYGGGLPSGGDTPTEVCAPTIITFTNVATLNIPYTAMLSDMYGVFPTVQVWIYDGDGNLTNMGIQVKFDAYPPTILSFDFGGAASGIVVIR